MPSKERVTSPPRATTVMGLKGPPTLFLYIPCLYIIDSVFPESTSIFCPGDYCCPFCNKVLKHINMLDSSSNWILGSLYADDQEAKQDKQDGDLVT